MLAQHPWQQAMEYMGRKVSESDQEIMRQSLGIEPGGKVVFQDFADLVKDMFKFKLDMAMMEPTLMGSIERKDSIEMPPLRKVTLHNCMQPCFILHLLAHRLHHHAGPAVISHIIHKEKIRQSQNHMCIAKTKMLSWRE